MRLDGSRECGRWWVRTLRELPGILIVGPRAVGKTAKALRFTQEVVRLDCEAVAAAFRADPDAALRGLRALREGGRATRRVSRPT